MFSYYICRLIKTQRRILFTVRTVGKFSKKYFNFRNDGMWELMNFILEHDEKYVVPPNTVIIDIFINTFILGKRFISWMKAL